MSRTSSVNSQAPSAAQQSVSIRSSSSNSSSTGCRRPKFMMLVVLVVLALGARAAPTTKSRTGGTVPPEVVSFLESYSQQWLEPCGGLLRTNWTTTGNKDAEMQTLKHLKDVLALSRSSLDYWRNQSQSTETTWSTEEHKEKFKFLRPFVANVSTWERRLSIYWASLALVITVHDQQSGTIDSQPEVLNAMRGLSVHNRQLLCHVQEYQSVLNEPSRPIPPKGMSRTLKFDIRDVNEIKIDRWYIMCRLNCYLNDMHAHVEQLIENGAARSNTYKRNKQKPTKKKQKQKHHCEVCPYSRSKALNKPTKSLRDHGTTGQPASQQQKHRSPKPQPKRTKEQQQQSKKQHKEKNAPRKQQQEQQQQQQQQQRSRPNKKSKHGSGRQHRAGTSTEPARLVA